MSKTYAEMEKRSREAEQAATAKVGTARDQIAEARTRGDSAAVDQGYAALREAEDELAHAREMRSNPDLHLTEAERMRRGARELAFGQRGRRR